MPCSDCLQNFTRPRYRVSFGQIFLVLPKSKFRSLIAGPAVVRLEIHEYFFSSQHWSLESEPIHNQRCSPRRQRLLWDHIERIWWSQHLPWSSVGVAVQSLTRHLSVNLSDSQLNYHYFHDCSSGCSVLVSEWNTANWQQAGDILLSAEYLRRSKFWFYWWNWLKLWELTGDSTSKLLAGDGHHVAYRACWGGPITPRMCVRSLVMFLIDFRSSGGGWSVPLCRREKKFFRFVDFRESNHYWTCDEQPKLRFR